MKKLKTDITNRLNIAFDNIAPKGRGRQSSVAKVFGVSDRTAGKWLRGEEIPDLNRFPEIEEKTGVRSGWIIDGRGDMYEGYAGEIIEDVLNKAFALVDEIAKTINPEPSAFSRAKATASVYKHLNKNPTASAEGLKEIAKFFIYEHSARAQ